MNLLSISPAMFRTYAEEYKKLARSAFDEPQRALYLKMASMWEHAALRFENGFDASDLTAERDPAGGDQLALDDWLLSNRPASTK
jgi:hypothetical protein